MPGKSHGLRRLVGYSPWGRKESDMTVTSLSLSHVCQLANLTLQTLIRAPALSHLGVSHYLFYLAMKLKNTYFLEVMTNLDRILKSRDIILSTKVHLVKAMVFPVVMYGCESWTIMKAECRRMMLLNCGVGKDS